MSIQYAVLGFEPTIFSRVVNYDHNIGRKCLLKVRNS